MRVEFNGSSMKAEMDGMGTPVVPAANLSVLNKFRNGTVWAVGAVILALVALAFYFFGAFVKANYLEYLPDFLLEVYREAGILDLLPKYISAVFGLGGIVLALLSIVSNIVSVVRLIKETEPISMTARMIGVLCDGAAIVIATIVVVLSILFI